MTQLKAGTEKCLKRKDALKLEALNYFLQSLKESGNESTLAHFSIGDSIYELLERFNSFIESESTKSRQEPWGAILGWRITSRHFHFSGTRVFPKNESAT